MPALRILLLISSVAVPAWPHARHPQIAGATAVPIRFHHVHYEVGDPSAAMTAVASRLEGVRVVLPGLGVGVRVGTEYLLFDRIGADRRDEAQPSFGDGYVAAVAWLKAHGVAAEPRDLPALPAVAALAGERRDHIAFVTGDLAAAVRQLAAAGAVPSRATDDAVLFEAGSGVGIELVRDVERAETFWCPMHADVRAADAGTCPICGMTLVPIPPPRIGEYRLDVKQLRDPGKGTRGLELSVREPGSNARVTAFTTVHEKRFHLFVVSRDLQYFAHVHPQQRRDGSFTLAHAIPPGEYMLIADFLPERATSQMVHKAIIVAGPPRPAARVDDTGGLQVALRSEDLAAGRHATLTFAVADARTGKPVLDLEPYLGAPAHLLIVRSDLTDAIHAHPEERATSGPVVSFHPMLPAAGDYKVWVQFQRGGRVATASFTFTVAK